jgi:hypothetical protein
MVDAKGKGIHSDKRGGSYEVQWRKPEAGWHNVDVSYMNQAERHEERSSLMTKGAEVCSAWNRPKPEMADAIAILEGVNSIIQSHYSIGDY